MKALIRLLLSCVVLCSCKSASNSQSDTELLAVATKNPLGKSVFRYWLEGDKIFRARCTGNSPYTVDHCKLEPHSVLYSKFNDRLFMVVGKDRYQMEKDRASLLAEKELGKAAYDAANNDQIKKGIASNQAELEKHIASIDEKIRAADAIDAARQDIGSLLDGLYTHPLIPGIDDEDYKNYKDVASYFAAAFLSSTRDDVGTVIGDSGSIPFIKFKEFGGVVQLDLRKVKAVPMPNDAFDYFIDGKRSPEAVRSPAEFTERVKTLKPNTACIVFMEQTPPHPPKIGVLSPKVYSVGWALPRAAYDSSASALKNNIFFMRIAPDDASDGPRLDCLFREKALDDMTMDDFRGLFGPDAVLTVRE